MEGLWLPTRRPFDRGSRLSFECDEQASVGRNGPYALGLPNDERCLADKRKNFVYCHVGVATESSMGRLCLSKLNTDSLYSLSTSDKCLSTYDLEAMHPIDSLAIEQNGEIVGVWSAQESILCPSPDVI